jgi:hypothetical protein
MKGGGGDIREMGRGGFRLGMKQGWLVDSQAYHFSEPECFARYITVVSARPCARSAQKKERKQRCYPAADNPHINDVTSLT